MNEQNKNNKNIVYAIIGILTLVVAITGATFAYYTATATNNATISGNMATISFNLAIEKVTKVDETKGGMIPMSNTMVEAAVSDSNVSGGAGSTCVDDNGNAVCQIYKITVDNQGSGASVFLDGYVTLTGGSGVPADYTTWTNYGTSSAPVTYPTTMRWAQVFCTGTVTDNNITACTTAGSTTTGASGVNAWSALSNPGAHATANIKNAFSDVVGDGTINGNSYKIIKQNYIRVSDHNTANGYAYDREEDVTSALVYNQYLEEASTTETTDSVTYYIAVWLSETGANQTAGSGGTSVPASGLNFFSGNVTFISSEGNEVTATFTNYSRVTPDTPIMP